MGDAAAAASASAAAAAAVASATAAAAVAAAAVCCIFKRNYCMSSFNNSYPNYCLHHLNVDCYLRVAGRTSIS